MTAMAVYNGWMFYLEDFIYFQVVQTTNKPDIVRNVRYFQIRCGDVEEKEDKSFKIYFMPH